jgi:hypothetical protein
MNITEILDCSSWLIRQQASCMLAATDLPPALLPCRPTKPCNDRRYSSRLWMVYPLLCLLMCHTASVVVFIRRRLVFQNRLVCLRWVGGGDAYLLQPLWLRLQSENENRPSLMPPCLMLPHVRFVPVEYTTPRMQLRMQPCLQAQHVASVHHSGYL